MKNKDVIESFLNGNKSKTKNIFISNREGVKIVYSYGYHFPLCVKLQDQTLIFNKERYSQTTSRHQYILARALGYSDFAELINKNKENSFNTFEIKNIIDIEKLKNNLELEKYKLNRIVEKL